MIKEITVKTSKRNELIDITNKLEEIVKESEVKDGILVVFVPHTTAGITINENSDPDVKDDSLAALEEIVPKLDFRHNEGNSDSHIKSSMMGHSETIIIKDSKLLLGTWQGIMLCEFDGPRSRKVIVKVIGD